MADKTDQEIAEQFLDSVRSDIIANHIRLGQKATGSTIESLKITANPLGGSLVGAQHIFALDRGRGPTRGGGSGGGQTLQQRIFDWLSFSKYGLTYADTKERTSLSWAIATIIHKRGTHIFRQGGSGLLADIVTAKRLDALTGAFARNKRIQFTSEILRVFDTAKIKN